MVSGFFGQKIDSIFFSFTHLISNTTSIVVHTSSTGGTRNTAYLFEQQKPKKKHKRRKLTQASKANKLIYKDRK